MSHCCSFNCITLILLSYCSYKAVRQYILLLLDHLCAEIKPPR
uniref:Uncharacterized protein n=1 Tax=Anguilla anguilla TaxID=7936 RepID=A0A0E9RE31_ANGAN